MALKSHFVRGVRIPAQVPREDLREIRGRCQTSPVYPTQDHSGVIVTEEERQKIWLRFLWSISLSDHLGDAMEAVEELGKQLSLPTPPWTGQFKDTRKFCEDHHVQEGLWTDGLSQF